MRTTVPIPEFHQESQENLSAIEECYDFLERFGRVYKHLHRENGNVYIVYPRCYCSQVNKIPKGKLSGTYCNSSVGWAKALFEGALERPVEVVMEKSIIRGDKQCKLKIIL